MSHRAYLTKEEVAKVNELEKAYTGQDGKDNFACSGIFPSHAVDTQKLGLYYQNPSGAEIQCPIKYVTFPLTEESAMDIYQTGETSPFGRGSELVYDAAYRQAQELKPPHFSLSYDILSASGLLALLAKKLDYEIPLEGRINKSNAYTQGGFFKPHKDTPQNKNHIGTLMICLPSPFTGGDLVIRQSGTTVTFDWAKQTENGSFAWGFLYSDCEHEVLPVTAGTRITIAYDIYLINNTDSFYKSLSDTRLEPIIKAFRNILDPNFHPNGGTLAFGLAHGYPFGSTESFPGNLSKRLKGSDALLLAAVRKLGLQSFYFAIYDQDDEYDQERRMEDGDPDDEVDAPARANDSTFRNDICFSNGIRAADGQYWEGGDPRELGLDKDEDLIWVTLPGSYAISNSYVSYGNEPQSETIYCAVGLKVELPAAKDRVKQDVSEWLWVKSKRHSGESG